MFVTHLTTQFSFEKKIFTTFETGKYKKVAKKHNLRQGEEERRKKAKAENLKKKGKRGRGLV